VPDPVATAVDRSVGPSLPLGRSATVSAVSALLVVELAILGAYLHVTDTAIVALRYTLYPFVWINVGAWVLLRRPTVSASSRRRLAAGTLALGYFLVLAVAGGLIRHGGMSMPPSVVWLSPGWGPALFYTTEFVHLAVLPFEVVGYAALAVLVYTLVLSGSRTALAGLLGVATCVGCLWPVGAAFAAILVGVGSPLASTVPGVAYDLSTLLFVVTAGALYWASRRTA